MVVVAACGGSSVGIDPPTTSPDPAASPRPTSSSPPTTERPMSEPATTAPPTTETSTTEPPTTQPATTEPGTTSAAPAPLTAWRFVIALEVLPHDAGPPLPVGKIEGIESSDPVRTQMIGEILDDRFELVSDGTRWWDLSDPDYELTGADIASSLLAMGFLQPSDVTRLLADGDRWEIVGEETHLGVAVTHLQRRNVVKDVDWPLGDLTVIDLWRDATGEVVKVVALFATGDNAGFPQATWELVERNPDVAITLPEG